MIRLGQGQKGGTSWLRVADDHGDDGEVVEHDLQKREVHLQAVLPVVGLREHEYRAKPMGDADALLVQGHVAERGGQSRGSGKREPVNGKGVAGS